MGKICFLIGEGEEVKKRFITKFPDVEFYTVEISDKLRPDFLWDVCTEISGSLKEFEGRVDLVVCQAVIEHILDPITAMKNFTRLLKKDGYLIVETPFWSFMEHRFPIDCIRYLPDWFHHIPDIIPELKLIAYHSEKNVQLALYRKPELI